MLPPLEIAKIDAAGTQIETAIDLYFCQNDIISIHTLAFAATNVLRDYCAKKGLGESMLLDKFVNSFPEKDRKEIWNRVVRAGNFFKHANQDTDDVLEFSEDAANFFLLESIQLFQKARNRPTLKMQAFRLYFVWVLYPESAIIPSDQLPQLRKEADLLKTVPMRDFYKAALEDLRLLQRDQ